MIPGAAARSAAWLAAAAALSATPVIPAAAQQNIDYFSGAFDCAWLEDEYERILAANERPEQLNFGGVTVAKVVTAPMFVIERIMGLEFEEPKAPSIGGSVNFSGAVEDVEAASRRKNCYQLSDRILTERDEGKLSSVRPAPVRSVLEEMESRRNERRR